MLRRGPGLVRTVARTAAIAGTATAVSGRVAHRQQEKYASQEEAQYAQQQQYAAPPPPPQQYAAPAPPPAAGGETDMAELQQLAELHAQGVLTDEEFAAKKAQILGI
jgi:hypothetical protein